MNIKSNRNNMINRTVYLSQRARHDWLSRGFDAMCTSVHSVPLFFKNPRDFTISTQVKSHTTTPLKSQVFIQHNSFRDPSKHQSLKLQDIKNIKRKTLKADFNILYIMPALHLLPVTVAHFKQSQSCDLKFKVHTYTN